MKRRYTLIFLGTRDSAKETLREVIRVFVNTMGFTHDDAKDLFRDVPVVVRADDTPNDLSELHEALTAAGALVALEEEIIEEKDEGMQLSGIDQRKVTFETSTEELNALFHRLRENALINPKCTVKDDLPDPPAAQAPSEKFKMDLFGEQEQRSAIQLDDGTVHIPLPRGKR